MDRRTAMQRTDSCVGSLISAFTSGLDVFKKLRERKREKKSKKARAQTPALQEKSGEELRLSKSLRRGTADIQGEYEKHYRGYGEQFAVGDCRMLHSPQVDVTRLIDLSNCPGFSMRDAAQTQHWPGEHYIILRTLREEGCPPRLQILDLPLRHLSN